LHNLGEDGLGHTETGFLQLSDRLVETDEPGLIGFIENGERAGDLSPLRAASCRPACSSMSTNSACI
jgi:hypothetical protein